MGLGPELCSRCNQRYVYGASGLCASCQQQPLPDPKVPWELSDNDKKFLRSIKVEW